MTRTFALAAAAALVALLGVTFWLTRPTGTDAFAQCRASQIAGGTLGGPFTLINSAGQTVTDADVITKPSLLYFGYTFCPDVCPFDVARNADAIRVLDERGYDVQPVFISIDPERDTPEIIGNFAANMHPKMIGLTGSPEQTAAASKAYRTFYQRQKDQGDGFYLVDHSTFSYLTLPDHGFVEFFRRDMTPDAMADAIACFVDAAAG